MRRGVVFVGISPREMMGRWEVQLMNDDGIDSHVPPLLVSSPGHRHQLKPRDQVALPLDILVSATWRGICWYIAS